MNMRYTTTTRRTTVAVAMTAAFALALAGCGGEDGGDAPSAGSSKPSAPASPSPEDKGEPEPGTAAGEEVDPDAKLAEARGEGLTLVIHQAKRDAGGFVTVQGTITNDSEQPRNSIGWVGAESLLAAKNPNSVAGATLVDKEGKKRYYVLRDTESRCLCTTGIPPLLGGRSTPVFMQFPSPPTTTTEVDFTLPTFGTTSLKISG
ncbi:MULTISPECIES: hypothetical protein [Streptomyces]|uniref:hypothetical protein n=1 Tax=Streptomyces TaxID=1883 RepID=UPI000823C817|nr:hypothetical protein [Streptomyces sp. ScaeMP-e48]WSS34334.1 hypothetical protein OG269_12950 [Streptomyces microflavus]WST17100.1 hypothetical protein OG721_25600 [Streptomyces microflavus]SCK10345.1 hypothetical protein YUYDRAFT_00763 [Streptomyces sp. ScaeMP-e48]